MARSARSLALPTPPKPPFRRPPVETNTAFGDGEFRSHHPAHLVGVVGEVALSEALHLIGVTRPAEKLHAIGPKDEDREERILIPRIHHPQVPVRLTGQIWEPGKFLLLIIEILDGPLLQLLGAD